jgi:hypothetical protein
MHFEYIEEYRVGCMGGMHGWDAWVGCMGGMHGWDAWDRNNIDDIDDVEITSKISMISK